MIHMVIADDEPLTREGLQRQVESLSDDIRIVGVASHGGEAYEICLAQRPDVLLIDVRMPVMDGFAVINALANAGCTPKVIVISGLQDFEFAQQAIRVQAVDYVLKPVDLVSFGATIQRVIAQVNREREETRRTAMLEQYRQGLAGEILRMLLWGIDVEEDAAEQLAYCGVTLRPEGGIAAVSLRCLKPAIEDESDPMQGILKACENQLSNMNVDGYAVAMGERSAALIVPERGFSHESAAQIVARMRSGLAKEQSESIAWGIGCSVARLEALSRSYESALLAEALAYFPSPGAVIACDEVELWAQNRKLDMWAMREDILHSLERDDPAIVQRLFSQWREKSLNLADVKYLALRWIFLLDQQSVVKGAWDRHLNAVLNAQSLSDLRRMIQSIMESALSSRERQEIGDVLSAQVKAFIADNYHREISLQELANLYHFSPGHISRLFRAKEGKSVGQYLTDCRLRKASEALENTQLLVTEIGRQVGYEDTAYFSRLFRKAFGVSPQQYRQERQAAGASEDS